MVDFVLEQKTEFGIMLFVLEKEVSKFFYFLLQELVLTVFRRTIYTQNSECFLFLFHSNANWFET